MRAATEEEAPVTDPAQLRRVFATFPTGGTGSYEFFCGQERIDAGPGWFVFLPHGVPHRYRAGPEGGRVLMLFAPGGTEVYFRDIAVAMADETTTGTTLEQLAEHHGIRLLDEY